MPSRSVASSRIGRILARCAISILLKRYSLHRRSLTKPPAVGGLRIGRLLAGVVWRESYEAGAAKLKCGSIVTGRGHGAWPHLPITRYAGDVPARPAGGRTAPVGPSFFPVDCGWPGPGAILILRIGLHRPSARAAESARARGAASGPIGEDRDAFFIVRGAH